MSLKIELEICEKISYAMYHNRLSVVSKLCIGNEGEAAENLDVTIRSSVPFFREVRRHADRIAPRSDLDLLSDPTFSFELVPEFFANLTENMQAEVVAEVSGPEGVVAYASCSVELLTYDMWPGIGIMPEMIAAFVTPNADGLAAVRARASDILAKWGCGSAFDGYAGGQDKVLKTVAALYAAVCEQNLNYSLPPNDFGQKGQRIRMADEVLSKKTGTCIDLAVLFASLFESVNLEPVVFFVTGHAFAGVHLTNESVHTMVEFSNSLYRNDIDSGLFAAIECTCAVNSNLAQFDQACKAAYDRLSDAENFDCAVELYNARQKIRPLPVRRLEGTSWVVERDAAVVDAAAPQSAGQAKAAVDYDRRLTKVDRWKRELLDLSTRNYLIKMKLGKKVVPLLIPDVAAMEDLLSDGKQFVLSPKPQEWDGNQRYQEAPFETDECLGNCGNLFAANLSKGYIHVPMTEAETEKTLRSVSRQAVQDLEESGCNSLFMVIGTLKWYDGKTKVPNYAPLILLPVQMRRTMKGFVVERLDEDTLFNVTLQEKLKQEFEIDIPLPDPLPADESGVDVPAIVQTVREAVKKRDGWEVFGGAGLGIFSFSQYAMWKDLDSNMDKYRENPVVKGLSDSVPYPPEHIAEDADPYRGCLVVPADGSQVKATNACLEHSFVMHGPPGTGKSQTITNMIANAMSAGQTVLFVAEKRAALEVVKKRLDKVGIGNHCLELHSNKAVKSEFTAQLKSAFDDVEKYEESELAAMRERLDRAKASLDQYAEEIHRPMVAGRCMHDLISLYEDNDVEDAADVRYTGKVEDMTEEGIEAIEARTSEACTLFDRVSDLDPGDLSLIGVSEARITLEKEAAEGIKDLRARTGAMESSLAALAPFRLPYPAAEFSRLDAFYGALGRASRKVLADPDAETYPPLISSLNQDLSIVKERLSAINGTWSKTQPEVFDSLSAAAAHARGIYGMFASKGYTSGDDGVESLLSAADTVCRELRPLVGDLDYISLRWKRSVFEDPAAPTFYDEYRSANNAGFLKKGGARKAFLSSVERHLYHSDEKYEMYEDSVRKISSSAPAVSRCIRALTARYPDGPVLKGMSDDIRMISDFRSGFSLTREDMLDYYTSMDSVMPLLDAFRRDYDAWKDGFSALSALLSLNCPLPSFPDLAVPTHGLCDRLSGLLDRVYDIANWNGASKALSDLGLAGLVPYVVDGMDEETLVHSAYRAFYKACLEYCRTSLPGMRTFGPVAFEKAIKQFKECDRRYTELNRNLLKCRLYQNLPSNEKSVAGTETYTLMKAIQATRIRKSIRSLISELPNVITKVCPCFLMSPLSVSQYLSRDFPLFDLVIFDESSQITTSKAICALGRARRAVIAGDNKQLPPTSFFQKHLEDTDDEELIDVDSFLDDCLALNMPETYLEWHYRSRHESLIAFSNRMYYGGKMLTFPSSNDGEAKVSAVKVADGLYERGSGKNRPEAEAVVEEIHRRVMDDQLCKQSIGVIAFSTRQQDCIQDILDDRAAKEPAFFDRLEAMPEGVFVKNLETVQGDERDVILFSIGYGRTKSGTVYQNFGPLNQSGGGRRLNVAVSRARCEMVVFTSMDFTDVKYTPSTGPGVRGMREFLHFAQNDGRFETQDRTVQGTGESSILGSLAAELQASGYICHFGIGSSGFHVDIAVCDPDREGQYMLGILSDGESFMRSDNARDREYARAEVLRNLGWNVIHVWSYEWYSDREEVVNRVLDRLNDIKEGRTEEADEPEPEEKVRRGRMSRDTSAAMESRRREYRPGRMVTDPDYLMNTVDPVKVMKAVIDAESPIEEAYLVKICGKLMGMKKVSENARGRILGQLHSNFKPVVEGSFTTYWKDDAPGECDFYRVSKDSAVNRKIEFVSLPEIRAAVVDTVGAAGSVARADAEFAVARTMEYARTGTNIRDIIGKVIEMEVAAGHVVLTEDQRLTLP